MDDHGWDGSLRGEWPVGPSGLEAVYPLALSPSAWRSWVVNYGGGFDILYPYYTLTREQPHLPSHHGLVVEGQL